MTPAQLTELNSKLLQLLAANQLQESNIQQLRECLQANDAQYYIHSTPFLADAEYDKLFAQLKKIETQNPTCITTDSPTQRVAQGLNSNFVTVPHLVPMLSLENSYNAADLQDWHRKNSDAAGAQSISYCIEPKYDGASISVIYENNLLHRAATRGDGVQGDDITANAKQIRSLALGANISKFGFSQIEIRGEVVMQKDAFAAYNESIVAEGAAPLANPRNAASGALRMKDTAEVAKRKLHVVLYHVSNYSLLPNTILPTEFTTHFDALQALANLGLSSSANTATVVNSIEEVINYVNNFEAKRDSLPYEIDGMVIKVNSFALQEVIGQTSHHPRWAMAYKFAARQGTSKLLAIEYQVGRTGSITPVAKISPVSVGGVTIQSISMFNAEAIKEKDLRIGDSILIERAGDVIPYIVKSFAEARTGIEQEIIFPTECPVCKSTLDKPEQEAVWRCINSRCAAQVVEKIIHFASKDAMDIRGLGDANIRKFYELGYLQDVTSIYSLPYTSIAQLDGFGAKSIEKMQQAIEASKQQDLARLIFGLGIRYVGETTAKTLARSIENLQDLAHKTEEDFLLLEDVGTKVAHSIVHFFAQQSNVDLLFALAQKGINMQNTVKAAAAEGGLAGKTFLFTGTLQQLKRSAAEAMVEAKGGQIIGGVSAKLQYLVVGEDAGSKLEKAKKLGTIVILTEEEFLQLLQ